jgi:hypothetical protein
VRSLASLSCASKNDLIDFRQKLQPILRARLQWIPRTIQRRGIAVIDGIDNIDRFFGKKSGRSSVDTFRD